LVTISESSLRQRRSPFPPAIFPIFSRSGVVRADHCEMATLFSSSWWALRCGRMLPTNWFYFRRRLIVFFLPSICFFFVSVLPSASFFLARVDNVLFLLVGGDFFVPPPATPRSGLFFFFFFFFWSKFRAFLASLPNAANPTGCPPVRFP